MVLWEITVATAYFLGLKRTYRIASKLQRKIVGPNHPKIRQLLHRRTRAAFDIALQVHQNIQQRDREVGQNLGNWILQGLDRMKTSAQICSSPINDASSKINLTKHVSNFYWKNPRTIQMPRNRESDRRLFTSMRSIWPMSFPAIAMMQPPRPAGSATQYRHLSKWGHGMLRPEYGTGRASRFEGVIRKDIMQYLRHN
uniref:Uncharacterized protein n=1 Tax=Rhizophora mucronata TaxID=61149 RepID=A0A2P2Q414_RHIMU